MEAIAHQLLKAVVLLNNRVVSSKKVVVNKGNVLAARSLIVATARSNVPRHNRVRVRASARKDSNKDQPLSNAMENPSSNSKNHKVAEDNSARVLKVNVRLGRKEVEVSSRAGHKAVVLKKETSRNKTVKPYFCNPTIYSYK